MKTSPLLKDGIRDVLSGEIKPSEWAALCCDVIEAFDKELSAWSFFDRALVASSALELDKIDWSQEKPEPLLAGAPIGVKDIFNTVDHPNSMGSEARKGYWPGNDARVVTWAKLLGAQIVGKTTTAEFAVDCAPDTINPWNKNIMPGTSSTGSAVAVATGMVPAALSSQSAGSIARPASYNGVVGFKASFGLIPRTGVLKTCDTLDTIGWMTRCVEDSKIICDALRVKGKSYPVIERGIEMNAERFSNVSSYKIGILSAPGFENILPDTATKLDQLLLQLNNKKNIELIGVDLRDKLSNAHQAHAKIYDKNLAYYFQRELENIEFISPIFQEIVDRSHKITPEEYFSALEEQEQITKTMNEEFNDIDFFILPTTAGEAPNLDQTEEKDAALIWTLTGCPSISLPMLSGINGYPVGVTIVGPKYSDLELHNFVQNELMPEPVEAHIPAEFLQAN